MIFSRFIITLSLFSLCMGGVGESFAQGKKQQVKTEQVAFDGYDLISYYKGELTKGKRKISYVYKGRELHFTSDKNMLRFMEHPERYFPLYDGWCANAVANGSLKEPNYRIYKIQNGEIMFFEKKIFSNGKNSWDRNPAVNKIMADKNYEEMFADL